MIIRIWHGYTTPENAPAYEHLLQTKIFPHIEEKKVKGYRKIELIRRPQGGEIEYITIMWFDSMEDVIAFAGKDFEVAYVLPEAQALLKRFDARSQHYTVVDSRSVSSSGA
jgi:antibiotic biosynthesis monooxygenase (ABM) superfamily enzyme